MLVLPKRTEEAVLTTPSVEVRQVDSPAYIEALVTLAQAAHLESRFSYIKFSPDKVRKIAMRALKSPKNSVIFLATGPSGPMGAAHCSVGEFYIGEGERIATIHVMGVPKRNAHGLASGKASLMLMNKIKAWAKDNNTTEILFYLTNGDIAGSNRSFAEKAGFGNIGGNFVFEC